ncbi:hypothetical protein AVEN_11944-1 [Araneus ventricosus]|uniref:Uncharacterized protein n=1 Tax=Araneus ventricosus TaxID=182803 RepID=A0A4Y2L551_ARAVE|nr:hypothetical protein AVEN_11944-1 [Araneus ventricosus]
MEFFEHGKEKAIISFKNRWKLAWRNGNAGIPTNSKSITSSADSNLSFYARVAAHQRICLDWDLAARLENRKSAVWWRRNRAPVVMKPRNHPTVGIDHWEHGSLVVGRPGVRMSSGVKGRRSSTP